MLNRPHRSQTLSFARRGLVLGAIAAMGLTSAGITWFHATPFAELNAITSLTVLALTSWVVWRFLRGVYWVLFAVLAAVFGLSAARLALEQPRNDRTWSPEMAAALTYARDGDVITLQNVRNFDWTSRTQSMERWETRTYRLGQLRALDVASLYWKGPYIAHTYFSFVWENGEALSLSVEIRKEKGENYSELGGLFRAYELSVLAGDERDFYGWRIHAPGEDLQLFRTRATPDQARRLLLELLDRANGLAAQPEFYNTLTNNCSTEIAQLTAALGAKGGSDWRTYATGFVPDLLYERGILDRATPLEELRARGHVLPAAQLAITQGLKGANFSRAIRANVLGRAAN
jgi:hypothetical protein